MRPQFNRQPRHAKPLLFEPRDSEVPPNCLEALRSSGRPLDRETQAFFEPRFGHAFSKVRIHTDPKATESAWAVNAQAYTVGRDVVFGAGQYFPSEIKRRSLLAHELAHTIQQQSVNGISNHVSDPSDRHEQAAELTAEKVMSSDHCPAALTTQERQAPGMLFRRVADVTCTPDASGAPRDPEAVIKKADGVAIPLATRVAANLATDSRTVRVGIPHPPSKSLKAFEDHFGLPVAAGKGFLNRLTGATKPTQEVALSEELAIVSTRFSLVARLMTQGLSYNCPGDKPLGLIGCSPVKCPFGDAFSCHDNSLVGVCSTFWTDYNDAARAQILIHESLHIIFGNPGDRGDIIDPPAKPGPGRNFNLSGCYEALLKDITGADSKPDCEA